MPRISAAALHDAYDAFLIDAYGVLLDNARALPGAAEFLRRLDAAGKPWLIVSNDASRSLDTSYRHYAGLGLPVRRDGILAAGNLLVDHFAERGLRGARCLVLGTEDSRAYVADAGGVVTAPDDDRASVLVVADDDGFPFLDTVNDVVSVALRRIERDEPLHLVLPNPDLIFPRGRDAYGVTAGGIAAMIEAILRLRDPEGRHRFVALGKPHAPIFAAALRRLPGVDRRRVVMIGDQILTDVRGARDFGLDSAFVLSGVGREADIERFGVVPTHVLPRLE